MCRALMPGDEENMTDEAVWETLPVRYYSLNDQLIVSDMLWNWISNSVIPSGILMK